MDKKFVFLASLFLIVSFSAGVFTEIAVPSEKMMISTELPGLAASLADYIKSDIITILAAMIFSALFFLMPLVILMVIGKTFSLGFTAAYILSSLEEKGFSLVIAALLPRGLFKLPAYIALIIVSYETAKFVRKNYHTPAALKGIKPHLFHFLFCLAALIVSSILETFLLQIVL